jgi:hypothetical protein
MRREFFALLEQGQNAVVILRLDFAEARQQVDEFDAMRPVSSKSPTDCRASFGRARAE